jgi:hypothetical protein
MVSIVIEEEQSGGVPRGVWKNIPGKRTCASFSSLIGMPIVLVMMPYIVMRD